MYQVTVGCVSKQQGQNTTRLFELWSCELKISAGQSVISACPTILEPDCAFTGWIFVIKHSVEPDPQISAPHFHSLHVKRVNR